MTPIIPLNVSYRLLCSLQYVFSVPFGPMIWGVFLTVSQAQVGTTVLEYQHKRDPSTRLSSCNCKNNGLLKVLKHLNGKKDFEFVNVYNVHIKETGLHATKTNIYESVIT